MESLYAKHCKEVLGYEIIEDENSFATFIHLQIGKMSCLKIIDVFINKDSRGSGKSLEMLKQVHKIAKERDCELLSAQLSKHVSQEIQNRTKYICEKYEMKKTYEDSIMYVYSRSI
jgi:N-acetylglutamate synthase-like GNAT family acetyltransferase